VDERLDSVLTLSRRVHAAGEIAYGERRSAAMVAWELAEAGFAVTAPAAAGHPPRSAIDLSD
jgi:metal-dependent amidase/aminoacylase/carboxypeptidase family protein